MLLWQKFWLFWFFVARMSLYLYNTLFYIKDINAVVMCIEVIKLINLF